MAKNQTSSDSLADLAALAAAAQAQKQEDAAAAENVTEDTTTTTEEVTTDAVATPAADETVATQSEVVDAPVEAVTETAAPVVAEPAPTPATEPEQKPVDPAAPANDLPHNPELDEYASPEEGQVIAQIKEYIHEMAPGRALTTAKAVQQHQRLYRAIVRAIEHLDNFESCFRKINKLVLEHQNGVFHEDYAFRFLKDLTMSDRDVKQYIGLIHVLRTLSDPKSRSVTLNHVDLSSALSSLSEMGRQRVMVFYGK
jgi:hypothetical protein